MTRGRPRADTKDAAIGGLIRTRRLVVGMTQEGLGDAIGVSFQQVQKYEKGANRVSASRLRQIAQALGVPVAHFYEGPDDPPEAVALDPVREGQGMRLMRAFGRIEDALVRQRVLDLVESWPEARAA